MASPYIFYSWQSQLPNSTNRGFIRKALDAAVRRLQVSEDVSDADRPEEASDADGPEELQVLEATQGIAGSPDITATILSRIESADIVVADISIVNRQCNALANQGLELGSDPDAAPESKPKLSPNANVLYELGYAMAKLGDGRIILVLNREFGAFEDLPFDLRGKRPVVYTLATGDSDRAVVEKKIVSDLAAAVKAIRETVPPRVVTEEPWIRIKTMLRDPTREIELHDLVRSETDKLLAELDTSKFPLLMGGEIEAFRDRAEQFERLSIPMCKLLAVGARWGTSAQVKLWADAIERITNAALSYTGWAYPGYNEAVLDISRYPGLLVLYCAGLAAVRAGRFDALNVILGHRGFRSRQMESHEPFSTNLLPEAVISKDLANAVFSGGPSPERRIVPVSDRLHTVIGRGMREQIDPGGRYDELFDRYEFFAAAVCADTLLSDPKERAFAPVGRFVWRTSEQVFDVCTQEPEAAEREGSDWPPLRAGMFGGSIERFRAAVAEVRSTIRGRSFG